MKRFGSKVLLFSLLLTTATGAWAQQVQKYIVRSWNGSQIVETVEEVLDPIFFKNSSTLTLGENDNERIWFVAPWEDITVSSTITIKGVVHIVLGDKSTLTVKGGIRVEEQFGACLYIHSQSYGDQMGKMFVTTDVDIAAGIGSIGATKSGTVRIMGGHIEATGSKRGAGIGAGGCEYVSSSNKCAASACGPIEIYGGEVIATGGQYAAGIGGGASMGGGNSYSPATCAGGTFIMYDGTVTAVGGELAAGLGGGGSYHINYVNINQPGGSGGMVSIYGGVLTATGGHRGAGIGSGNCGNGSDTFKYHHGGTFTIYGGEVHATGGGYAAGIGGGCNVNGGTVNIKGGTVVATGGEDAAGIGGGEDGGGGTLQVSGGLVVARGTGDGAGIGGGGTTYWGRYKDIYDNDGRKIGTSPEPDGYAAFVTVKGGIVIAVAGKDCNAREEKGGSAIGGGKGYANKGAAYSERTGVTTASLTLDDNYNVSGADSDDDVTSAYYFTCGERDDACRWRNYVVVASCSHQPKNDDTWESFTYTILDESRHQVQCRYCKKSWEENHQSETSCICDLNKAQCRVNMLTLAEDASITVQTINLAQGRKLLLREPSSVPEGFEFLGWAANVSESSGVIYAKTTDNLMSPGSVCTIPAQDRMNLVARYRLLYEAQWEWNEDHSAKVKLTNKWDTYLPRTSQDATVTSQKIEATPTEGGGTLYTATYTYQFPSTAGTRNDSTFTSVLRVPYPGIALSDDGDNTQVLQDADKNTPANVTLSDRTLYHSGTWNTLCLPFSVYSLSKSPLYDAEIMELTSSSFSGSTLTLNFEDATYIEAGKPYLVKWIFMPEFDEISHNTGIGNDYEEHLFDDNVRTKWCFNWKANYQHDRPNYCTFTTSSAVNLTGYSLTTGDDTRRYPNRNPAKWVLEGKLHADDEWTVIDTRNIFKNKEDALPEDDYKTKSYTAAHPGLYRYFRFTVNDVNGYEGDEYLMICQLSELMLIGTGETTNTVDPLFGGVTISEDAPQAVTTDAVAFVGSYSPVALSANDKSVLYMGNDSRLYYPAADMTIGACRAYFKLQNGILASETPSFASIVLNFEDESTSIEDLKVSRGSNDNNWYTLDGRRLSAKPTRRGIYIHGGKKEVVM